MAPGVRKVCSLLHAHACIEATMVAEFECFFGRISAPVTWSMAKRRAGLYLAWSAAFARHLAALMRPRRTPDMKAIGGLIHYLVTAAATQNGVFLPLHGAELPDEFPSFQAWLSLPDVQSPE